MSGQFGTRFSSVNRNRERALVAGAAALMLIFSGSVALWIAVDKSSKESTTIGSSVEELDPMISVLVPVRDIERGQALRADMFREERRPLQFLKVGTIRSLEEIKNRYADSLLLEGEPLVAKRISSIRQVSPISPQIRKDRSAVTIRVDDLNSASGMVQPGEFVDIAWIHTINSQPAITRIVKSALVLAADQQVQGEIKQGIRVPGALTLLVTPSDAMHIQLAARTGTLSVALRGPEAEYEPGDDRPVTYNDVAGTNEEPVLDARPECRGYLKVHNEKFCVDVHGNLIKAD